MRSMVEWEALPHAGAFEKQDDEHRGQPVAGSVSHATTLRAVPLSQEGEDCRCFLIPTV